MKKTIQIIAVSFIIFSIFLTMNFISYCTITGKVISPDIKLRKKADDTSTVLELIPKNEEVEVLEENGKWCKVKYNKITGYVHSEYVEIKRADSSSSNEKENKVTKEEDTNTISTTAPIDNNIEVIIGDNAYVKEEENLKVLPLINADIVSNISKDTQLNVIQILNGWAYVSVENAKGWLRYDVLTKNKQQQEQDQTVQTSAPTDTNEDEKDDEEQPLNKTGYVTTDGINFRESKDTSSKVIKVLSQNAQLNIIKEDGQWYKATFKEETGYILKMYVSDKKVTTSRGTGVDREQKQEDTTTTEKENSKTVSRGQEVVDYVKTFLGSRYVYGGASPSKGFDCSGLTMYVYKKFGVNLPHSATAQSKIGAKVEKSSLQLGDLVFFSDYRTYKGIGHCGIYIGDNKFIHASTEKTGVITSSLTSGSYVKRYVGATRVM